MNAGEARLTAAGRKCRLESAAIRAAADLQLRPLDIILSPYFHQALDAVQRDEASDDEDDSSGQERQHSGTGTESQRHGHGVSNFTDNLVSRDEVGVLAVGR